MDDELKGAWQSQTSHARLVLDATSVLNEVRRKEREFAATIFRRDLREIGVALVLIPIWIYMGSRGESLWTWYLTIPALLWIAGFMTLDRMRQRRREPAPGESLRSTVESSLAQVEHQIWLLRNVFWWYLLPLAASLTIHAAHTAWQSRDDGLETLWEFTGITLTYALVFWFVHWLNQYAVRMDLEPRREELRTLLSSLSEPGEPSAP